MKRGYFQLFINGEKHRVTDADAFLSLSDYLRVRRGLCGTKIVCSEGDCGACSVLVARLDEPEKSGSPGYRAVDACLTWMFQLDRTHVITVEGLEENATPHPVQDAMVACHGSQCGFCTPGFVIATVGLLEDTGSLDVDARRLDDEKVRRGLTGNLCRCTGYVQICNAARSVDPAIVKSLRDRHPVGPMLRDLSEDMGCVHLRSENGREVFAPTTLNEALDFLSHHPGTKIVAGATDVGVAINKGLIAPQSIMYIGRLGVLGEVYVADGELVIGAAATWAAVEAAASGVMPEFAKILSRFGAPQIRHSGTVGGNVINASPIADSLPLLFVTDARLRLVHAGGERTVRVNDFYLGYKKLDLRPGELLAEVRLTIPRADQSLRLYKISKRRDLDISTFTAAVLLTLEGQRIVAAKIAYGGVAPVVVRLPLTEAFLAGKPLSEAVMTDAGVIARGEITPISDVRATAEYRLALAETILLKAFFDLVPEADAAAT
jgi:xanthine dehydrogenase small subunit